MSKIPWTTETRRLGDLIPWEPNPRQLTKDQAVRLRRSIAEFGYSQLYEIEPDNTIIDGHQRDEIMLRMDEFGADAEIEVRVAPRKYTLEERKEYIALKHRGAVGEWDWEAMHNLYDSFEELEDFGFDADELLAHGFEPDAEEPPEDPGAQVDRADELREKWGVETGQLWQLGEHRLICGDCTDGDVVEQVMGGEMAQLCVTSPPYFNQREYSQWKNYEDYIDFATQTVDVLPMSPDSVVAVNIGSDEPARRWMPSDWWIILRESEWMYRECIAWVKAAAVWSVPRSMHIENGHYFPAQRWEVILVVSKGNHPRFDIEDRDRVREFQENVWNISVVTGGEQKKIGHDAVFPEEIPSRFCTAYSQKGANVYEPFSGSGTTLIACERLGRKCRAVEISPAYCAVAIERWHQMTGGEPVILEKAAYLEA